MTISVIIAIILGWMLVNMWLTLISAKLTDSMIYGWDDMILLLCASIVTPFVLYLIVWSCEEFKKRVK